MEEAYGRFLGDEANSGICVRQESCHATAKSQHPRVEYLDIQKPGCMSDKKAVRSASNALCSCSLQHRIFLL